MKALHSVADACRQLIQLLPSPPAPSAKPNTYAKERIFPIQLVIYFDEAHSLLTPFYTEHDPQRLKTRYDVMLSCLEDMRTEILPIFSIFLSTNSGLRKLAPSAVFARSAQMTDPDAYAQAPITELPFDCFRKFPEVENFESLSSVEFLTSFGRPLYVCSSLRNFIFVDINLIRQVVEHGRGCRSK